MKILEKYFFTIINSLLLSSCGMVSSPLLPGSEAAAAKNQIMLVRQNPPSLGFQRLSTQARSFPDIKIFIAGRGIPDFLAETGQAERRYFIFYYLKEREAFACRTRIGNSKAVEFAGPYSMTKNEHKLLNNLRRAAEPGR